MPDAMQVNADPASEVPQSGSSVRFNPKVNSSAAVYISEISGEV